MTNQHLSEQKSNLPVANKTNPWLEAASEAGNDFGRLLKFVKGRYESDGNEVPLGSEFVAYIDQVARAWVRFEDGKLVAQHISKIASGDKLPPREKLGHLDPEKWEKDPSGQPKDPWAEQWYLAVVGLENGEVLTFVTGSKGGIGAIARLCNVYGRRYGDGTLPIVALKVRSYKHKLFGRVETPDLEVVGWDGTPLIKRSASEELDDELPY
jgi:hypothetical protein